LEVKFAEGAVYRCIYRFQGSNRTYTFPETNSKSPEKWWLGSGKFPTFLLGRSLFAGATLQGTNISHLGKRKIIFKMPFLGGYVSFQEGMCM